jgi:hypothetical protein
MYGLRVGEFVRIMTQNVFGTGVAAMEVTKLIDVLFAGNPVASWGPD